MKRSKQITLGGLAMIAAAALLAGCGSAPTTQNAAGGGSISAVSGFKPCIVSDEGGFDDHSFNQSGWEGVEDASNQLGVTPVKVQSKSQNDYAPNLKSLLAQSCTLIVSVGYALAPATGAAAKANLSTNFVSIDDPVVDSNGNPVSPTNVKPLLFDTAQAAFLAGYLAAGYSTTKVIGTFGGANYPTVSIFMDGFKQGVDYYNKVKSASVKLLGWNGTDGSFTGGFTPDNNSKNISQSLVDQNADVILPVGGAIYQSTVAVIQASGKNIAMIGVDADVTQTDPKTLPLTLTSIMKGIKISTSQAVLAAGQGKFDVSKYVGTLANQGVGIAPYHNFDSKVPQALKDEVTQLQKDIISGKVTVKSYLAG